MGFNELFYSFSKDFPANRPQLIDFKCENLDITSVIELIPSFQCPLKTRDQLIDERKTYIEEFAQVKQYFADKSVVIHRKPYKHWKSTFKT